MDIERFSIEAKAAAAANRKALAKLKAVNDRTVDGLFHEAHTEVFEQTDCLACANCCKTTSPIFYNRDVDRAARALGMKPGIFVERYIRVDDEGDMVLKSSPCPFLDSGNMCTIYHDRPAACREYPHTDRKRMTQILDITYRNTLVCPAVHRIVEMVKKRMHA